VPVDRMWYSLCRLACRLFCILFLHFRVRHAENICTKGGFLLVSNHQSYLDPVFCGVALKRRLHFLARDTLFSNRLFGALIRSLGAIPVRRGKADLRAIKTVISKLKAGEAVCLFPEGTRTSNGRIAPLRAGLGLLCKRASVPVVPMVIEGAFECWPRHKKLFSPGKHITVCYGKAITAAEAQQMNERELAEHITVTLRQMQAACRQEQGKQPYQY